MFGAFLRGLPRRFVDSYRHYRWAWHVLAAVLTILLVLSGFDWWFFEHTRVVAFYPLIMFAGIGGFFIPVLLPVGLYVIGEWRKNNYVMYLGAAVAQAEIVTLVIVSIYKTFTGRMQPEFLTHFNTTDISKIFHFGFFQNGIFFGWPSSHVALAMAAMTVLFLSIKNPLVRVVAVLYALAVMVGAAVGFHWFSDVVAGTILGILIGTTTHAAFKSLK